MDCKLTENGSGGKELGECPSFFKVLIGDFSDRLRIPPQFLKHLSSTAEQNFVLRNPSRRCWNVHAERVENTLYLKEGWKKFVKDNAIEFGEFLVFFYIGDSNFDVLIYGKTCCQKLPVIAQDESKTPSSEGNADEEAPEEKNQQQGRKPEIINIDSDDENVDTRLPSQKAADKFESQNPHFSVLMRPSYVVGGCINIPINFWQKHLDPKVETITLKVSKRSWTVKFSKQRRALRIGRGWRRFTTENKLKQGDVCVFELINKVLMHVTIFRA